MFQNLSIQKFPVASIIVVPTCPWRLQGQTGFNCFFLQHAIIPWSSLFKTSLLQIWYKFWYFFLPQVCWIFLLLVLLLCLYSVKHIVASVVMSMHHVNTQFWFLWNFFFNEIFSRNLQFRTSYFVCEFLYYLASHHFVVVFHFRTSFQSCCHFYLLLFLLFNGFLISSKSKFFS